MKLTTKLLMMFVLALNVAATAMAQPALYVEGTHYEVIADPVRTSDPNKVEVSEIFLWLSALLCI